MTILCCPRQAERALEAARNLVMQSEHHALFNAAWSTGLWQVRQKLVVVSDILLLYELKKIFDGAEDGALVQVGKDTRSVYAY